MGLDLSNVPSWIVTAISAFAGLMMGWAVFRERLNKLGDHYKQLSEWREAMPKKEDLLTQAQHMQICLANAKTSREDYLQIIKDLKDNYLELRFENMNDKLSNQTKDISEICVKIDTLTMYVRNGH